MAKLFCAIVGVAGSAFSVRVDEGDSVYGLKHAIRKKNPATITCPARKLQLFLTKKDGAWLDGAGAAAVALDEDGTLRGFGDRMDPTLSLKDAKCFGEDFQPGEGQVHMLVVVPKQEASANPPQIFPTFRPYIEGIDVQCPHLSRDALIQKLYNAIMDTNFVLLSSPVGSGKTSLLTLFARRHPEFRYVPVAFDNPKADATALLVGHGVDLVQKTCRIPDDKLCVFMLDDCERQYRDVAFWIRLIKGSSSWLPTHVRFIISATHLLETDAPESPIALGSIPWRQHSMEADKGRLFDQ